MKHDSAGDPMGGLRWTHRTTEKISQELRSLKIEVSPRTVSRLLRQMGFSLRVNHKKICRVTPAERDAQFSLIADLREHHAAQGSPVISVDTKKKEKVGNFKNAGVAWSRKPVPVNDHDFLSDAIGKAIPYGIYDIQANRGALFVGTSYDTPAFAVNCISRWWRVEGQGRYPNTDEILILADGGGSNGYRSRAWKWNLQHELCDRQGLTVTVAHYPPGASKWNPIEHRLFSEISKNWAACPLDSYDTILRHARTTRTRAGLRVRAQLVRRNFPTGVKISDAEMKALALAPNETLPAWNYTLTPRN